MKINAEQLQGHLQKAVETSQLSSIYIVSGNELLLRQEAADAVRTAAYGCDFTEREVFHIDTTFDWYQVLTQASSMSLFGGKKIIELRIPSGKLGHKGQKTLREICDNVKHSVMWLIILPKLQKATYDSAWFKKLDSVGVHIQVWPIAQTQLPRWIQQRLSQAGIESDQETAEILAERVEGNLLAAMQEVEKLKLLVLGQEVDAAMVSSVIADSTRFNVFDLVDRILGGDVQSVSRILNGLQREGSEPLPLLGLITRELRVLTRASEHITQGMHTDQALRNAGVWNKKIPLSRRALQRLKPAHLRMFMHQAGAIERGLKGIRRVNCWDEITTLALSMSGKQILHPSNIKTLLETT